MTLLERLKELAGKATPGPWSVKRVDVGDEEIVMVPSEIRGGNGSSVVSGEGGLCPYPEGWEATTLEANAEFITLSRNAMPLLLELAEAAKAYVEDDGMQTVHLYGELEVAVEKLEGVAE